MPETDCIDYRVSDRGAFRLSERRDGYLAVLVTAEVEI
jgi:hypothetical protein